MMKRKSWRKILGILLSLVLLAGLTPAAVMAAGMPFTDVERSAWYYNDVADAYDTGLVVGTSATTFEPAKNLTYAEAVTLAARMYQTKYEGAATLQPSTTGAWYQTFVDYAGAKGIISKDYAWNENATRAGYMEIFAGAFKPADLPAINTVDDGAIPDVPMSHPQASAIYTLYRAGILRGNDDAFSCLPANNITRAEMSAILTRMMNSDKRVKFTIKSNIEVKELQILTQTTRVNVDEGKSARFEVVAVGGTAPYTYEWRETNSWEGGFYDGTPIDPEKYEGTFTGRDTATMTYSNAHYNDNNYFLCAVTDATGKTVLTDGILLKINAVNDPELKVTLTPEVNYLKVGSKNNAVPNKVTATVTGGNSAYYYRYNWEYSRDGENFTSSYRYGDSGPLMQQTAAINYTTTIENPLWIRLKVENRDQKICSDVLKLAVPTDKTLTTSITGITTRTATIDGKSIKYIYLLTNDKIEFKFNYTATGEGCSQVRPVIMAARDTDNYTTWHNANENIAVYADSIGPASGVKTAKFKGQTGSPVTAVRLAGKYPDGEIVYSDEILYIVSPMAVRQWTADKMSMVNIAGGMGPFKVEWEEYNENNESVEKFSTYTTKISQYSGRVHALTGDGISNSRSYNWAGIRQSHHEKVSDYLGNSKYICIITDAVGNKIVSRESQYGDESNKEWYYNTFWEDNWESWYSYDIHDDQDGTVYIDTSERWGTVLTDGTVQSDEEAKWESAKEHAKNVLDVVDGIGKLFGN